MFCPTKVRKGQNQKANVTCTIQCSGCHTDYVGKKDRNLITRLPEHRKKEDQPIFHIVWQTFFQIMARVITQNMFIAVILTITKF